METSLDFVLQNLSLVYSIIMKSKFIDGGIHGDIASILIEAAKNHTETKDYYK